jgi:two-component system cell cycle sensor histidine kinase/response regulator CckA
VFVGCHGLEEPWRSGRRTPLSHSFCQHIVASGAPLVVSDARAHPLLADNPAISELHVVAYAGVPLHNAGGLVVGVLCAIDNAPRRWKASELAALEELAAAVEAELALRLLVAEHAAATALQATQRRCLEALATDQPLEQVLTILTEGIAQQLHYGVCAVMLRDPDTNTLQLIAPSALPRGYVANIARVPIGPCCGSCGTAAYINAPVIASDIASDPLWASWRDLTLSYGLRACWSLPIRDAHGNVLGTFACWYHEPHTPDARERQVVEEAAHLAAVTIARAQDLAALRASEARYRLLATAMDDVVTLHDLDGRFRYASPSHVKVLGYTREGLIGHDCYQFMHPDDRERVMESHAANLRGEATLTIWRFVRPDGGVVWLETRAQPLAARDGEPAQLLCVSRDVSARVTVEHSLIASQATLAALFANTADGIWSVDRNCNVVTANDAFRNSFRTLFGRDLLIGSSPEGCLPPDEAKRWRAWFERALAGQRFSVEYVATCDATTRWFDVAFNPIHTAGQITGVSVFSHNITERKQAETQRLAHERAWQATQRLESLGVLAGGVAHDFNNLLMAVRGNAELAASERSASPAVVEHLDQIVRVTEHASDLVRQILIYAGRKRPKWQRLNPRALLYDMHQLLRAAVPRRIALEAHIAPATPPIAADATQLRQVVLNLLVNAAEAIGDAPGRITLSLDVRRVTAGEGEPAPGRYVELAVTDTGRGMDAATVARIAEPFFTTKATGRGLGLAVVHGIVRGHRGVLQVQSTPQQGTTFRVLLPCPVCRYRTRGAARRRPQVPPLRRRRATDDR